MPTSFSAACWAFGAVMLALVSVLHPPTVSWTHGWWVLAGVVVLGCGFSVGNALRRTTFSQFRMQQ